MVSRLCRVIVLTLLVVLLAATGGPMAAQPASVSGTWKGKYSETNGHAGDLTLQLSEKSGRVTGSWNGTKIEKGQHSADTLAWGLTNGKTVYTVRGKIQDGGKKLTLDYTFVEEKEGKFRTIKGKATLVKG